MAITVRAGTSGRGIAGSYAGAQEKERRRLEQEQMKQGIVDTRIQQQQKFQEKLTEKRGEQRIEEIGMQQEGAAARQERGAVLARDAREQALVDAGTHEYKRLPQQEKDLQEVQTALYEIRNNPMFADIKGTWAEDELVKMEEKLSRGTLVRKEKPKHPTGLRIGETRTDPVTGDVSQLQPSGELKVIQKGTKMQQMQIQQKAEAERMKFNAGLRKDAIEMATSETQDLKGGKSKKTDFDLAKKYFLQMGGKPEDWVETQEEGKQLPYPFGPAPKEWFKEPEPLSVLEELDQSEVEGGSGGMMSNSGKVPMTESPSMEAMSGKQPSIDVRFNQAIKERRGTPKQRKEALSAHKKLRNARAGKIKLSLYEEALLSKKERAILPDEYLVEGESF